jgi:hypothetical protein
VTHLQAFFKTIAKNRDMPQQPSPVEVVPVQPGLTKEADAAKQDGAERFDPVRRCRPLLEVRQ